MSAPLSARSAAAPSASAMRPRITPCAWRDTRRSPVWVMFCVVAPQCTQPPCGSPTTRESSQTNGTIVWPVRAKPSSMRRRSSGSRRAARAIATSASSGVFASPPWAEAGRYQLVTAPSCPWAHRTVLMRTLKGLKAAIPLLESDLPKGQGWAYSQGFDDLRPKDGAFHVHQVYTAARPDYTGRATVPVLWDRETRTIVNNESPEIIRMLNSEFDEFGDASLDLYPEPLRRDIDEINAFVYDAINNGVYRTGLA